MVCEESNPGRVWFGRVLEGSLEGYGRIQEGYRKVGYGKGLRRVGAWKGLEKLVRNLEILERNLSKFQLTKFK